MSLTECGQHQGKPAGPCELESVCQVRGHWRLINQAIQEALGEALAGPVTGYSVHVGRSPSIRCWTSPSRTAACTAGAAATIPFAPGSLAPTPLTTPPASVTTSHPAA